jgi:hypothetical protein
LRRMPNRMRETARDALEVGKNPVAPFAVEPGESVSENPPVVHHFPVISKQIRRRRHIQKVEFGRSATSCIRSAGQGVFSKARWRIRSSFIVLDLRLRVPRTGILAHIGQIEHPAFLEAACKIARRADRSNDTSVDWIYLFRQPIETNVYFARRTSSVRSTGALDCGPVSDAVKHPTQEFLIDYSSVKAFPQPVGTRRPRSKELLSYLN